MSLARSKIEEARRRLAGEAARAIELPEFEVERAERAEAEPAAQVEADIEVAEQDRPITKVVVLQQVPQVASPLAQLKAAASKSSGGSQGAHGAQARAVALEVGKLDFRIDQYGQLVLCRTTAAGRFEVLAADGVAALDSVAFAVASTTGATPTHEVLKRELGPVRARAREVARGLRVFNRAAPDGAGGYVIDIGDGTGTAVFVDAQGWVVKPQSTVAFRRGQGYGALAVPDAVEKPAEAWERVHSWLAGCGVRKKWIPAVIVMLVDWFRPDTPNPIAELVGAAGSGKSTLAARLARLVDPTTSGGLASVEITEPGIGAAAMNRYVLAHDNAGGPLKEAAQDLLCKVSTGGTLAARRLYTQDEEFQVDVRSPFILTAIIPVITRADARSRTLRVKVSKREEFSGAVGVDADFENQRGVLTGALLSLLASGLAGLDQARQQKYQHRLVDFEQLGEAITAAVGWAPGGFQALMREHRKSAAEEAAESIPVVVAVLKVIEKFGALATCERRPITENGVEVGYAFRGNDGSLTVGVRLRRLHEEAMRALGPGQSWTGEKATANSLTVHEPTLEALGVTVAGRRKMKTGVLVELSTRVG